MYRVSSLCVVYNQPQAPTRIASRLPFSEETNLVEKDILAIAALGREVLQVSILADTMLQAQLLPELTTDYRESPLARTILGFHCIMYPAVFQLGICAIVVLGVLRSKSAEESNIPLLPHWPAWIVIISLRKALILVHTVFERVPTVFPSSRGTNLGILLQVCAVEGKGSSRVSR